MKLPEFLTSLDSLLAESPKEALGDRDKVLVLSDLHLGNGGSRDDLRHNRDLVLSTLRRYYLEGGWKLVLNGDIEDLSKFELSRIRAAWPEFYRILEAFHAEGRLRQIVGNHDLGLAFAQDRPWPVLPSLLLEWRERRLFVFHGHQASGYYLKYDRVQDFFLRWFARPLGIMNRSVARDSRRRYKTERTIYRAARLHGLVAIAGHTHRPLFESLGKWDSLRFSIERLLDEYENAEPWLRTDIRELIELYRDELERMKRKEKRLSLSLGLYDEAGLIIPCYFNSGTGIGKHGYTALEIADSSISLVHWAGEQARPYIEREALERNLLEGSPYSRFVLKQDSLERVFDRIDLLSGRSGA